MKLTLKTLKGVKFQVDVEESNTVEQVKGIIEKSKPELAAAAQKLIHSGKVLKDEENIGNCGIKPNDFLVVMVTKPKKTAAAPAAAPAATSTPKTETTAPAPAGEAAAATTSTTTGTTTTTTATTTTTPAPSASAAAVAAPAQDNISDEAVSNLTAMGFPEAEVRHCLRVAHGNPDIAVEFLTNGIPEGVAQAASMVNATTAGATPAGSSSEQQQQQQPLQALRNHPQFNDLRRLVQSNPQMLQQVLIQIGQQQPELLQEINANQALFLEMMNEPVTETSSSSSSSSPAGSLTAPGGSIGGGGLEALTNPVQMAQLIQSMDPNELEQMAQMMGLSPEQLRMTAQMLGQMPPEQLQQFMMQAMGSSSGADDGMDAAAAAAGMMGGGGPQVLRLTQEEMAAVDRLTEMGFDRSEAAQAFLACDKNEALAANLLMDSMGDGGFFGGGGGGGGSGGSGSGGGGGNNDNNNDNNNDEGGSGNNNDNDNNNNDDGNDDEEMYD